MKRMLAVFAALVVLFGLPGPSNAGEVYDPVLRDGKSSLSAPEARTVVKYLLRNLIGPAVSSTTQDPSVVSAWGCEVLSDKVATCEGKVVAGDVTCTGTFKVREYPTVKAYAAYPIRMECTT